MKKLFFFLGAGLLATTVSAQDLPQPSPFAKVEQSVGVTHLKLEYSRPGVKNRTVFGELVPYDQVWRFGANACTKISTNTAIEFNGKTLAAGTYSVFATPSQKGDWTIAFNTDIEHGGTTDYDPAKNVLTVNAKTSATAFTESFTLDFANVTSNSATIVMRWEKLMVEIPFTVKTNELAEKNIQDAIAKGEDLGTVYYKAAAYYSRTLNDDKKAMEYIEKGMQIKETYGLLFLHAQILQKEGKTKVALEKAQRAYDMALADDAKGFADFIKSTMDSWK